jgi:hypothetical protein
MQAFKPIQSHFKKKLQGGLNLETFPLATGLFYTALHVHASQVYNIILCVQYALHAHTGKYPITIPIAYRPVHLARVCRYYVDGYDDDVLYITYIV